MNDFYAIIQFILDTLNLAWDSLSSVYIIPGLSLGWLWLGMTIMSLFIGYWVKGIADKKEGSG